MGRASRRKQQGPQEQNAAEGSANLQSVPGPFLTRPLVVFILLSLLAFLIYANSLSCPFTLDDRQNIVENEQLRHLANFLHLSGTRYLGSLSFALNYAVGGLQVFGYHLVNILIHIANGFLVYSLILLLAQAAFSIEIGGSAPVPPKSCDAQPGKARRRAQQLTTFIQPASAPWVAVAAALLFVAHPIQTQSITYIVQRYSSLVATFYLLTIVCYLKWRMSSPDAKRRVWWYAASLCSCVFAMKTKENSFTLPVMILLVEGIFFRDRKWKSLIPFLLTLLIIPIFHLSVIEATGEGFARDTLALSRLEYLFTQFRVIVTYLRLLVLPINQSLDYDYPTYHSLLETPVWVSFLFLSSLVGVAVVFLRRASTSSSGGILRLTAFGILWFFVTLSIESSIVPIKDVFFEHRIYLPSVGFFIVVCFLGAWIWERWPSVRWLVLWVSVVAVCGFSVATIQRNRVWQVPVTFWEDVVRKSPNKARPHNNLGEVYQDQGRLDDALREFQTAVQLNPNYAEIHYNVGQVFAKMGRLEDSAQAYQTAIMLKPGYAKAHLNLGGVFAQLGRTDDALKEFTTVITLQPDNAGAHNNLGNIYTLQKRFDDAIREYQAALRLRPELVEARKNMDHANELKGKPAEEK